MSSPSLFSYPQAAPAFIQTLLLSDQFRAQHAICVAAVAYGYVLALLGRYHIVAQPDSYHYTGYMRTRHSVCGIDVTCMPGKCMCMNYNILTHGQ